MGNVACVGFCSSATQAMGNGAGFEADVRSMWGRCQTNVRPFWGRCQTECEVELLRKRRQKVKLRW